MPVYDVTSVGGQPHQRIFTISVKVGFLSLSGDGTSKKDAKREAATKMFDRLKGLGPSALPLVNGTSQQPQPQAQQQPEDVELAKIQIDSVSSKTTKQIQQFYGDLNVIKKGQLFALHRAPVSAVGPDFAKFLNELAKEQKFNVTFVNVEESTEDGLVQSLVQISSLPVAVCLGIGKNTEEANNDAAKNALLYLKVMTKKKLLSSDNGGDKDNKSKKK